MRRRAVLCALLSLSMLACGKEAPDSDASEYASILPFDSTTVGLVRRQDTLRIRVQLALSDEQKSLGLMERRRLPEMSGMLFVYDSTQPPDAGFWMYRTRISLDIAFIDSVGVIRSIRQMTPCETTVPQGCPSYAPGTPYRYALEVNQGFFARYGIGVESVVDLAAVPRHDTAVGR